MTDEQATARNKRIDSAALRVASILRDRACPHGIPMCVLAEDVTGFVKGVTPVRPLCDACVMSAVRQALEAA